MYQWKLFRSLFDILHLMVGMRGYVSDFTLSHHYLTVGCFSHMLVRV